MQRYTTTHQEKPCFVELSKRISDALDQGGPELALKFIHTAVLSGLFPGSELSVKNPDPKEYRKDELFPADWDLFVYTEKEIAGMPIEKFVSACTGYVSMLKGCLSSQDEGIADRYTIFLNATGRGVSPIGIWVSNQKNEAAMRSRIEKAWSIGEKKGYLRQQKR